MQEEGHRPSCRYGDRGGTRSGGSSGGEQEEEEGEEHRPSCRCRDEGVGREGVRSGREGGRRRSRRRRRGRAARQGPPMPQQERGKPYTLYPPVPSCPSSSPPSRLGPDWLPLRPSPT